MPQGNIETTYVWKCSGCGADNAVMDERHCAQCDNVQNLSHFQDLSSAETNVRKTLDTTLRTAKYNPKASGGCAVPRP